MGLNLQTAMKSLVNWNDVGTIGYKLLQRVYLYCDSTLVQGAACQVPQVTLVHLRSVTGLLV